MLFTSLEFLLFFLVTFFLFWNLGQRSLRLQNLFIISASYFFYAWWDYRFLSLIILSSLIDYMCGLGIARSLSKKNKKCFLIISVCFNLGLLFVFKYFDFFVESFGSALLTISPTLQWSTLDIILPVGISFYTFQTMSYTIDLYQGKIPVEKDPISFFAFVSFFPQLVAGPIERASNLLGQFNKTKVFSLKEGKLGLKLILWGYFQKMVVADNLAPAVNYIFQNHTQFSGMTLLFGVSCFAFQIYGDFAGYSNIARGLAKLLGFNLMVNFKHPYFAKNIPDFWNRWHISLSSWFRDYLYIPLGGSRHVSHTRHFSNIVTTFTLSGLWHGANMNFIAWGFIHSLAYIPFVFLNRHKEHLKDMAPLNLCGKLKIFSGALLTFAFITLTWIFFRQTDISLAYDYLFRILTFADGRNYTKMTGAFFAIGALVLIEWFHRNKENPLEFEFIPRPLRWMIYYILIMVILLFKNTGQSFIYFQF